MKRDDKGVVELPPAAAWTLRQWMDSVTGSWIQEWKGRDHRYGHDFAAFLGERFLTDFDMREAERKAKA